MTELIYMCNEWSYEKRNIASIIQLLLQDSHRKLSMNNLPTIMTTSLRATWLNQVILEIKAVNEIWKAVSTNERVNLRIKNSSLYVNIRTENNIKETYIIFLHQK